MVSRLDVNDVTTGVASKVSTCIVDLDSVAVGVLDDSNSMESMDHSYEGELQKLASFSG